MSALLRIDAVEVRQDAHGRFSLNDLHRSAGGEQRHRPKYWLENQQTQDLIDEIGKGGIPPLVVLHGGSAPGTYVCRELVYAYAMWVSPAFHLKVIRTFDAVVREQPQEEPLPPGPKAPLTYVEALQRVIELQQQLLEARRSRPAALPRQRSTAAPREHPWLSTIRAHLEGDGRLLAEVTTDWLLGEALGISEPNNVQRGAVGRCMSRLGWRRGRRRTPAGLRWVYVRPGR